jgi:spore protease
MEAPSYIRGMDGIHESTVYEDGLRLSRIVILTEAAARRLDKPRGTYLTLEAGSALFSDAPSRAHVAHALSLELARAINDGDKKKSVLVVGLGNRFVTPDALGPKTAEHILVTRHIHRQCPGVLDEEVRSVTAFSASVMGVTGMETVEVVSGITKTVDPDLVLLVDALASSSFEHLGAVIQMNDSGISPGSGIGNNQTALCAATLGVPVITLGVPLVVSAETIVNTALRWTGETQLTDCQSLPPEISDMIVTPKNIDAMVTNASKLLSRAINLALHGEYSMELESLLI